MLCIQNNLYAYIILMDFLYSCRSYYEWVLIISFVGLLSQPRLEKQCLANKWQSRLPSTDPLELK